MSLHSEKCSSAADLLHLRHAFSSSYFGLPQLTVSKSRAGEEIDFDSEHRGRPDMAAGKQETVEMSQQSEFCSVCLEIVEEVGERSIAKLKCGHQFHLDCIGSAFNAKGAMQCPNCRHLEDGNWLYANGNYWSNDIFNEGTSFDDEHEFFYADLSDEPESYVEDEVQRSPLESMWCPYENLAPQSTGRSYPPHLSSLRDSEGTRPFSSALLDTFLSVENTGSVLMNNRYPGGFLLPRQTPEDSQSRPPGHEPESRDSSMENRAIFTERLSSTERSLEWRGRYTGIYPLQSGLPTLHPHLNMQHNVVPATPTPDIDGWMRMDASGHLATHHETHASVWSSFVNDRQAGYLPYHLWDMYENGGLRPVRGYEATGLPGSGSSSNTRVSSSVVGSLAPHLHQRAVDSRSSPATTSHGSDSPAHSSRSIHGINSTSHDNSLSASNECGPWNNALSRSERCDTHDNHSGNSLHPGFYLARQPVPNLSQAEISAPYYGAAGGAASSSSSPHHVYGSGGIRRMRTSFVSPISTSGQPVLVSADQNRRFSSPCPWLNAAAANQEPTPVTGMEGPAIPSWRRDLNSTVPLNTPERLLAELRTLMRSVPTSQASRGPSSQSIIVISSTAPLTTFSSEGQGGSPGFFPGYPRVGVLPNSYP